MFICTWSLTIFSFINSSFSVGFLVNFYISLVGYEVTAAMLVLCYLFSVTSGKSTLSPDPTYTELPCSWSNHKGKQTLAYMYMSLLLQQRVVYLPIVCWIKNNLKIFNQIPSFLGTSVDPVTIEQINAFFTWFS